MGIGFGFPIGFGYGYGGYPYGYGYSRAYPYDYYGYPRAVVYVGPRYRYRRHHVRRVHYRNHRPYYYRSYRHY